MARSDVELDQALLQACRAHQRGSPALHSGALADEACDPVLGQWWVGLVGGPGAVNQRPVVGERSAYIVELEKGRLIDRLDLADEDAFLLTPIKANGKYLIAATATGLSAFSSDCKKEKSGKQLPLNR